MADLHAYAFNKDPLMPISKHVQNMTAYTPGEQPRDKSVIKLNTNENPYPPSPRVAEALATLNADDLSRYPDPVCRELREALAEVHACTPEQIFVGNGSDEVLALCLRAFVEDDGRVGFFDPSYSLYPVLCAIRDVATVPVPLDEGSSWATPGLDTQLFFLTRPNAPTGLCCDLKEVELFATAYSGVVILDEAYAEFADSNGLELARTKSNVLVTRSFSKSYALAGLRVGYAIGDPELITALYKIKDSYNVDRIAQTLATAAVRDQAYLAVTLEKVRTTRERVTQALRDKGFDVASSQANFVWAKPPEQAETLFRRLYDQHLLIRWFPGPRTGDYLRISIGTDAQMDTLLSAL